MSKSSPPLPPGILEFIDQKNPIELDAAYQNIDDQTWHRLFDLAQQSGLFDKRSALFSGAPINISENRPALHTALRNLSAQPVFVNGEDVMPDIHQVWRQIDALCNKLVGVTDIIHIGIGGSDFGPRLVCDALETIHPHDKNSVRLHFLANIDSAELANILSKVQALSTRVIIVSKTFTTLETMENAKNVIQWFKDKGVLPSQLFKHVYGVTSNVEAAQEFGLLKENILPFWDWVGGRFSVWSAVGLPIALKFGFSTFMELLAGAYAMDRHFQEAPHHENQPLLLALSLLYNQQRFDIKAQALIPYAHALSLMPQWLQQLDMESNGKSCDLQGAAVTLSSPVIFGSAGTNAQHSFFQMLHQGPEIIPVDFIAVKEPMSDLPWAKDQHHILLANCLAQAQALANGKANLEDFNQDYPGGRPSNLIWLPKLNAFNIGALLSLYEHRAFCLGVLWNLNSFDQPGVELGKKLAQPIHEALANSDDPKKFKSALGQLDEITAKRLKNLLS